MKTPILKALEERLTKNYISFHTPGHKGRNALIDWSKYVPHMDTTEIEGMDNLLDPQGIIKESQDYARDIYGTRATYYSVNGSTGSIHISLASITMPGDKVLVQRNCHKAVFNGLILNRLNPVYLNPNYNKEHRLTTGLDLDELEDKLRTHPGIKLVIITYPDYYGICSDIEGIVRIVHKYGALLMVDEAHGSHFNFSKSLPKSSIDVGADIVIHSIHKTLPSLTQTSLIHVCSHRIDLDRLRKNYQIYTTSSPSYLFMISAEAAISYMNDNRAKFHEKLEMVKSNIKRLESIEGVKVFTGDRKDPTIKDKDITKILLGVDGYSGRQLSEILHERYYIDMEMSDPYYALALSTIMNEREDFNRLYEAMEDIAQGRRIKNETIEIEPLPQPTIKYSPHEAYHMKSEREILDKSLGKISASTVIPYPPGIPLIVPGELISLEILQYISSLKELNLEISGLLGYNREYIEVVKERS